MQGSSALTDRNTSSRQRRTYPNSIEIWDPLQGVGREDYRNLLPSLDTVGVSRVHDTGCSGHVGLIRADAATVGRELLEVGQDAQGQLGRPGGTPDLVGRVAEGRKRPEDGSGANLPAIGGFHLTANGGTCTIIAQLNRESRLVHNSGVVVGQSDVNIPDRHSRARFSRFNVRPSGFPWFAADRGIGKSSVGRATAMASRRSPHEVMQNKPNSGTAGPRISSLVSRRVAENKANLPRGVCSDPVLCAL